MIGSAHYLMIFYVTSYPSSTLNTLFKRVFYQPDGSIYSLSSQFLILVIWYSTIHTSRAQDTNTKSFINVVYKALRRVPNLRRFELYLSPKTKAHFYSWISAALLRNVSQVYLTNSLMNHALELPYDLCTSKTLVHLNLGGEFSLNSVDSMCLPSLKTLHLEDCCYRVNQLPHDLRTSHTLVELKFSGTFSLALVDSLCCLPSLKTLHLSGSVECMGKSKHLSFSTFPVLEDLCFACSVDSDITIDITISSLKNLKLELDYGVDNLILNAPALEFLDYFCTPSIRVSCNILDSLVKAHILVDLSWKYGRFQRLFEMISSVHNLSLSWYSKQALTLRDSDLPMFQNLTRVELYSFDKAGWNLLPDLLDSSPNLELLIFKFGLLCYRGEIVEIDNILPRRECACLSRHLKELEVRNFYGVEFEFQLVESFLKNSQVLKKIVICSTEPPETRHMICQRLLAFPRYSSDCQIVVLNKSYLD